MTPADADPPPTERFASPSADASPPDIRPKTLALPPLLSTALIGFIALFEALGAQMNIHGGGGLLLMLAFTIGAVSAAINLVLVPQSVLRLTKFEALRTPLNYWSIGIGAAFLLLFVAWVGAQVLHAQIQR